MSVCIFKLDAGGPSTLRTDIESAGCDVMPATGGTGDDADCRPRKSALVIDGGYADGGILHRQGRCGEKMDPGSPGLVRGTIDLAYGYVGVIHRQRTIFIAIDAIYFSGKNVSVMSSRNIHSYSVARDVERTVV